MYETENENRKQSETSFDDPPAAELDWDAEIRDDSNGYAPLPDGDYIGRVLTVERDRHNGSPKIPPCPKAVVKLLLQERPGRTREMTMNLFLHSKMEWKLSEFFRSIGQKKYGERLRMDWAAVPGSRIRVHVSTKKSKNAGEEREFTNVDKCYDYDEKSFPADPHWLMAELQREEDTTGFNPFEESEESELPY